MPRRSSSGAAGKVQSRNTIARQKEECTVIIANAFPDFAEDIGFCRELAEKVLECVGSASRPSDFKQALEDALAGVEEDEAAAVLASVYTQLLDAGLVQATNTTQSASVEVAVVDKEERPQTAGVTAKRLEVVFSKEIGRRERAAGGHVVSSKARSCAHTWDSTGAGGVRCQVCNFETKDNHYCCTRGCDVQLCGKCWWKWRERLQ